MSAKFLNVRHESLRMHAMLLLSHYVIYITLSKSTRSLLAAQCHWRDSWIPA